MIDLSIVPNDTLIFACPYPLTGCRFLSLTCSEWSAHIGVHRRSAAIDNLDVPRADSWNTRRFPIHLGWTNFAYLIFKELSSSVSVRTIIRQAVLILGVQIWQFSRGKGLINCLHHSAGEIHFIFVQLAICLRHSELRRFHSIARLHLSKSSEPEPVLIAITLSR